MGYSKKELLWWQEHPGFEGDFWWNLEGGTGEECYEFAEENPLIVENLAGCGKRRYRPGPIFWESLRRHPALKEVLGKLVGLNLFEGDLKAEDRWHYSEQGYTKLVRKIRAQLDLSQDWQRALFYLAVSHQKCWINLPVEQQTRFSSTIGALIQFLRPDEPNSLVHGNLQLLYGLQTTAPGTDEGKAETADKDEVENKEGTDEQPRIRTAEDIPLGEALTFPNFVTDTESGFMPRPLQGEAKVKDDIPEEVIQPQQRILFLDRLEAELAKVGKELIVFAVDAKASKNALVESFSALMEDRPNERPIKLETRILDNIAKTDIVGPEGDDARKQIRKWFEKYDLGLAMESI